MQQQSNTFIFQKNYYFKLLLKLTLKKKSIYVIGIVLLLLTIFLAIMSKVYASESNFSLFSFVNLFVSLSLTIILASYLFLVIFKDLSSQSIDIIAFTKPYNRQYFIATKILFLIFVAFVWAIFFYINSLIFYLINFNLSNQTPYFYIWGFFSPLFAFLIFGSITALISIKFSGKIALASTLISFSPFVLLGSASAFSSTSTTDRFARILNLENAPYDSNTIVDVEKFYLNDKKDHFFIIPKHVDNYKFSERQTRYIGQAWNDSTPAPQLWQTASYLLLPYQFINVFDKKDNDALVNAIAQPKDNLDNFLYYNNLDSKENAYFIDTTPNLPLYKDSNNQPIYLVPGALKNESHFVKDDGNDFVDDNLANRQIIYANEHASDFNIDLPEDAQTIGASSLLVGKLKWSLFKNLLESKVFGNYAQEFFSKIDKQATREDILKTISTAISEDSKLLNLTDPTSAILNPIVNTEKIQSETQRKIYLGLGLIYWLYFKNPYSPILQTILKDSDTGTFDPQQIDLEIDNSTFKIGGYSSYAAQQRVSEKTGRVITRFNLTNSKNFAFQPVSQIIEVKVGQKVVVKGVYPILWLLASSILLYFIFRLYSKKDYR